MPARLGLPGLTEDSATAQSALSPAMTTGLPEIDEPHRQIINGVNGLDVVDARQSANLVPVLLLAYERVPCAFCRGRVVEALLERGALPDSLREECRWDSNGVTRDLVGAVAPWRAAALNAGSGAPR